MAYGGRSIHRPHLVDSGVTGAVSLMLWFHHLNFGSEYKRI
jgi:hypothetical protein